MPRPETQGPSANAAYVHKTTCALNSTGHRGPCTCGAESAASKRGATGGSRLPTDEGRLNPSSVAPPTSDAAAGRGVVTFLEYGTHKTIQGAIGTTMMSGSLRVWDQATIDALREAFEKAGWTVTDRAC